MYHNPTPVGSGGGHDDRAGPPWRDVRRGAADSSRSPTVMSMTTSVSVHATRHGSLPEHRLRAPRETRSRVIERTARRRGRRRAAVRCPSPGASPAAAAGCLSHIPSGDRVAHRRRTRLDGDAPNDERICSVRGAGAAGGLQQSPSAKVKVRTVDAMVTPNAAESGRSTFTQRSDRGRPNCTSVREMTTWTGALGRGPGMCHPRETC